jgi:chromosome segregation ATPase
MQAAMTGNSGDISLYVGEITKLKQQCEELRKERDGIERSSSEQIKHLSEKVDKMQAERIEHYVAKQKYEKMEETSRDFEMTGTILQAHMEALTEEKSKLMTEAASLEKVRLEFDFQSKVVTNLEKVEQEMCDLEAGSVTHYEQLQDVRNYVVKLESLLIKLSDKVASQDFRIDEIINSVKDTKKTSLIVLACSRSVKDDVSYLKAKTDIVESLMSNMEKASSETSNKISKTVSMIDKKQAQIFDKQTKLTNDFAESLKLTKEINEISKRSVAVQLDESYRESRKKLLFG